jgi:hypothetical protein
MSTFADESATERMLATTRFQHPFNALTSFFHPSFQRAFNSTGGGTVTRGRDTTGEKKSLPALVCPVTLPNKVADQRQLLRDLR